MNWEIEIVQIAVGDNGLHIKRFSDPIASRNSRYLK